MQTETTDEQASSTGRPRSVYMADALAAEVERIATQLDRSMSWVICQAVREFLGRVDLPAGE